jgi:hypothetical protein
MAAIWWSKRPQKDPYMMRSTNEFASATSRVGDTGWPVDDGTASGLVQLVKSNSGTSFHFSFSLDILLPLTSTSLLHPTKRERNKMELGERMETGVEIIQGAKRKRGRVYRDWIGAWRGREHTFRDQLCPNLCTPTLWLLSQSNTSQIISLSKEEGKVKRKREKGDQERGREEARESK